MKFAIVQQGGKQYRAVEGQTIEVDRLEVEAGEAVRMGEVLLITDGDQVSVGAPTVPGASVEATVLAQVKGPKLTVFRYKPKKRERKKTGHRQTYTRLHVDRIIAGGE